MVKLGIHSLSQLNGSSDWRIARYLRRACYVGLYEDAGGACDELGRDFQEHILRDFSIANGIFKRTSRNRMGQFDDATIEAARQLRGCSDKSVIHDVAVSDGRTACELFLKLSAALPTAIDFYASDLVLKVFAIQEPGRRTKVVVDSRGNLLQLVYPPFVLPMRAVESWLFPVNRLLRLALVYGVAKRLVEQHQSGDLRLESREVILMCREVRELLASHSNFHLDEYDVFEPAPRRYTMVRALNIFNLSYFSKKLIKHAINNVFASLDEGGLFAVGSNGDAGSEVDGGIYQKRGRGFLSIYSSGRGAVIDDLICQVDRSL